MAADKQMLVLEFIHTSAGLQLADVKDVSPGTRDSITVSKSRNFPKEKAFPVINIKNIFNTGDQPGEQASRTLVIKVAGTTSAVITLI
jgi:hypothetical protein